MARRPSHRLSAPGALGTAAGSDLLMAPRLSAQLGQMLPPVHVQQLGGPDVAPGTSEDVKAIPPPSNASAIIEALLDDALGCSSRRSASRQTGPPLEVNLTEELPLGSCSKLVTKASPSLEVLASKIQADHQRDLQRSAALLAASRFWPQPIKSPPRSGGVAAPGSEQPGPAVTPTSVGMETKDLLWQLAERIAVEALPKGAAALQLSIEVRWRLFTSLSTSR